MEISRRLAARGNRIWLQFSHHPCGKGPNGRLRRLFSTFKKIPWQNKHSKEIKSTINQEKEKVRAIYFKRVIHREMEKHLKNGQELYKQAVSKETPSLSIPPASLPPSPSF